MDDDNDNGIVQGRQFQMARVPYESQVTGLCVKICVCLLAEADVPDVTAL
jgi:hypothetical protein